MRSHRKSGLRLVGTGLALGVVYAVVIWYGVFANDTADQVCGPGVPHRDHFFPPYTACGPGPGFRVTSALAEFAGSALFILSAATLVSGLALMIAGQYQRGRRLRDEASQG